MSATEIDLHHSITGPDSGTPVVFTHGWLNTSDVWSGVVAAIGDDARSLTWDLRGHGRSGAAEPGKYDRSYALGDLDRMVDMVGSPAILAGHSLGGYLSLAYALKHPEKVAGLVLVAAGPGFRNPESREQWNDAVRSSAEKVDIPDGQEEISVHVDSMVIDRLDEITVPTVTVVGERDKRFLASADVFDKYLNVTARMVVEDGGHMVHAKHPDEVAGAVQLLIQEVG